MNKRGSGIIGYFFILLIFCAIWGFFLADLLATFGAEAIATNNLTGLEAFIWGNLNLWVLLGVLGAGAGGVFLSGGQQ